MDLIGIILIIIIVVFFYKFYYQYQNLDSQTNGLEFFNAQPNYLVKNKKVQKKKYVDDFVDFLQDDCVDRMNCTKKVKKIKLNVNPYFQEMQFHQDYRDTMNAFTLLCDQKKAFNKADLPILKAEEPKKEEVENLVKYFIKELNKTVKNNVSDIAGQKLNSWQDNMPITAVRKDTSWDKFQKELGLPTSIYPEPAEKAGVKLVQIDHTEKMETSSDIRYSTHLILQKKNVEDQIVVKVSFVMDKTDTNLDREFFEKSKNSHATSIIIEEITIEGFMITKGFGEKINSGSSREKFYNFEGFSDGRMISEKEVIRQLNEKKKEIQKNFIKGN
jgi:hypothetical protein